MNSNQIGRHSKAPVSGGFYVSCNAGESCYRRHGSPAFPYTRGGTFTSIARKGTHVTKLDHLIEHLLKRNMRLLNASLDQRLPNYERMVAEIREEELSEVIGLLMDLRDETTSEPDLETLLLSAQTTD